jgi:hypothetical protein
MAIINMSGDSAFLEYRGLEAWDLDQGGYKVNLETDYDLIYGLYPIYDGRIAPILIFYYTFPLLLIYLIEFQNVTFRRLAKRCELQSKWAPTISYILALTIVSANLASVARLRVFVMNTAIAGQIVRVGFALIVIGWLMIMNNNFRWKTKSIYEEHTEPLLDKEETSKKTKNFSELLFSNWKVLIYEITQKCVFFIALSGEPISTLGCAFVAYVLLAITAAVAGRSVAKEGIQKVFRYLAVFALLTWYVLPKIYMIIKFYPH